MSRNHSSYQADRADIVIVGNGIAGLTAAIEARRLAPDTSIVVITDQSHPTINTPALKQFAIGKLNQEQLLAYPAGIEHAQRIHVISGRVEGIRAQSKFVCLEGGQGFGYGSLVIATGSVPTPLPAQMPGRNFDGVLSLHCLQDYLNLRRRLPEVEEAVVIGGGVHAIETVMALVHLRIQVHWLIRGKSFLPKTLDEHASEMVLEHVRQAGVKVYMHTQVAGIVGRVGSVIGVVTSDDRMIPCEMVLTCTGTTPTTTLAERCDLPMAHKNGILVDDQLRTNVRDIYAVGAVAALRHPQTGHYETRPLWYAATLQGRTVAAMMTGHSELASRPFGVPWHAAQLGDLCMLSVGGLYHGNRGITTVTTESKRSYRCLSLLGDRLIGYLALGPHQPDSLAIKRIIDEGHSVREIEKALLSDRFDASKYFSQRQVYAARELVTSGKIPAVQWLQRSAPTTRTMYIPPATAAQPAHTHPITDKLPSTNILDQFNTDDEHDEQLPQTGPLHSDTSIPQQMEAWLRGESDREGSMAELASAMPLPSAMPISLPSRSISRSLWSYSDKAPVVEARPAASQEDGAICSDTPRGCQVVARKSQFLLRGGQ